MYQGRPTRLLPVVTTLLQVDEERGTLVDWPWRFLALISAIPPHAWDAISPRGRVHERLVDRVGELAGSGPLVPHESVLGARLLQGLAYAGAGTALLGEVDEWCATGWPGRWPRPQAHRRWDEAMIFAGGALAAARLADLGEGRVEQHAALAEAAHRLAVRALAS